jgi:hypothetical protein
VETHDLARRVAVLVVLAIVGGSAVSKLLLALLLVAPVVALFGAFGRWTA